METIQELKELFEDTRYQMQAEREVAIMDAKALNALEHIRDLGSAGGASLFKGCIKDMQLTVRETQGYYMEEVRVADSVLRLLSCDPDQIVATVYTELLAIAARDDNGEIAYSVKENTLARRIGRQLEQCARLNAMKSIRSSVKASKALNDTPLVQLATEMGIHRNNVSKWKTNMLPACFREVSEDHAIALGRLVLGVVYPDVDHLVIRQKCIKSAEFGYHNWVLREDVAQRMATEFLEMSDRNAALGFMICEPRPLTSTDFNARGRYVTPCTGTKSVPLKPSEITIRAANATQTTRYTINKPVLAALESLTQSQVDQIVGIQDIPEQANEGESPRQFASRVRSVEDSNMAKRQSVPGMISAALEAIQFDAVYFPVYLDFRGRQYTVDYKGLGPQTTKTAKALLQFAEGRPLGQNGLWALYHELGNAMGYDKDIMEDKINKARNVDTTDRLWFLKADEPLKALAIQNDIDAAIASGNPSTYVSHQIVYVDGSCNGMQHLSLMTRDEQGGRATNVVGDESAREDLYMKVAEAFMTILEDDHSDAAMYWKQFDVSQMRKRVKRGVMTLPYGVTKQGIADQVINDGFCVTKDRSHTETQQQAAKFKDCLWEAMADAAPKAMELRAWMIECMDVLCGANAAPQWATPVGTEVIKSYRKPTYKRFEHTGMNTKLPIFQNDTGVVDIKKNKAAIVANLIHSFDAAMLQDTMVRMLDQDAGSMSFVHDSYGCTAGDMSLMNETLRASAYDMYSVNQMEAVREHWQSMVDEVLPACPEFGSMCVEEVLESPYFFA